MFPMALREGAASADPQWARLQVDVNCRVRRGAWYRVADLTSAEARLDVNREQIPVPRTSLKIVTAPPQHWTIVARPRDARSLPAHWGDKYAVCPGCRNRMELKGAPHTMRCARCECVFRSTHPDEPLLPPDAEHAFAAGAPPRVRPPPRIPVPRRPGGVVHWGGLRGGDAGPALPSSR